MQQILINKALADFSRYLNQKIGVFLTNFKSLILLSVGPYLDTLYEAKKINLKIVYGLYVG